MRQDPSPATLPAAVEHLTRDVIDAWRGLWRERAFALTTVTTLAVALALVMVVFTIFNAYVLRPYAVRDPYSLHEIRAAIIGTAAGFATYYPARRAAHIEPSQTLRADQ